MSRHIPARPEQTQSLSDIVRDALRAAALAPDTASALDVAGAALCDIAQLARREQPTTGTEGSDLRFRAAVDTVDATMRALDRLSSIFEAIQRCVVDTDIAVEDLATLGREIVQGESDRLDVAFTRLAHQRFVAEACHG